MKLTVKPLSPELWPAIENLFESGTACKRCWCMYWRIGSTYRTKPAEVNKAALYGIVQEGPPPGLLAFDDDNPVGWCQLSSRDSLPWLDRTSYLKRVDDLPVWCISCFYVRNGYRKHGVTSALISEALNIARNAGVPSLEAYPLDQALTSSTSFTGFLSTFRKLGFYVVKRRVPARPIMRHTFER
jgi:GNAT superfamily N-acetyltransferase